MSLEQKINYQLNKYPGVKKVVKSIYQHAMYAISPKVKSEGNITRISPDDSSHEYFFGYYDKSPWDITDHYMLCMRANNTWSDVSPKEKADILLIDNNLPESDKNRVRKIAETSAWNVQQSCMLQWLGPDFSSRILFNDCRDGKYVSVIKEVESGAERVIGTPVYTVSFDGKTALTLDFSRLYNLRPGYGYYNVPEKTKDEALPDATAVWKINLESGEAEPLLTYKDFATFQPRPEMQEAGSIHKVNHLMLSPSGKRFMVLYRWFIGERKYTRLITCNVDGTDMYVLSDDDMVSHCFWKDDEHILAFENKKNGGTGYYLMKDRTQEYKHCWLELTGDGHPSYSPDRSHIVTDSYPDRARIQYIRVMKDENSKPEVVAKVFSPFRYDNDTRCDLHPRWNHVGDKVCFDSVFEGHRGLYSVPVITAVEEKRNNNPKFSIITPMYNSFSLMQRYFDSIQRQTYNNFEVILIDDCSSDDTYERVRDKIGTVETSILLLRSEKNGGAGKARNLGLKAATGDYVLFVDSDDYVSETLIESLSKVSGRADIIFYDYYRTDGNKRSYKRTLKVESNNLTKEAILLNTTTSVCGKAIKKEIIDNAHIEFPDLYRYEDWVFMSNAIFRGSKYSYLQEALYYYYNNPKSVVNTSTRRAFEYSIQAFDRIEPLLKVVSNSLVEALYAREVLYVASRDVFSSEYKDDARNYINKLQARYPNWYKNEYISGFAFPQKMVLHLIHRKKYALLSMICKVAR